MSRYPRIKTAIWDCETDGLLGWSDYYKWDPRFGQRRPPLSRIHCLIIRDYERRVNYVFRHNSVENTIEQGLEMLEEAELLVGQNIIHFDIPALSQVFNDVTITGSVFDTLPMCRMVFANQKDLDFRLYEKGLIEGKDIGKHTLESWGRRLGILKGDYVKDCEALGVDPWGAWSQDMEDYCVQDVAVTVVLYEKIKRVLASWGQLDGCIIMEHSVHDLMGQQERNGIYFDRPAALKLEAELRTEAAALHEILVQHFGKWWAPEKKWQVKALWDDPGGVNKAKEKANGYHKPRAEYGEDLSRPVWGDVTLPKKSRRLKDPAGYGPVEYAADAPYCKVECNEFNPGSRVQIIDRLVTVHAWNPVDFTEKGNPEVNDEVLRRLADGVPMAEKLAELFYYNKRLGQLADGAEAWLRKADPENLIHHYCNSGGTISGRASHIGPNMGQVPKVKYVPQKDEAGNVVLNSKGKPKMRVGIGREGDHGFECRSLFYVPEPWIMVGADLQGIELRCFGEALAKFDGGAYLELVLSGDPHTYNQNLAGLPTRDNAKTFIYACVPMDTLALTKRGWKGYDDLQIGELVLTYNANTKVKEWKPVLEKVRYEDAEVIELKNDQTFSVRCTPNHRWFTWKRHRVNGYRRDPIYEVVSAQDLNTEHNIIVNAPINDLSESSNVGDLHVMPKWNTDWSQKILNMSDAERKAWLAGFCVADGYWMKNDTWTWCQNKGSIADAAIIASYLSWDGRLILNDRANTHSPMTVGRQCARDYVTCQRIKKIEHPRQPVWCIRTENESWVMRQGNTITITGNTIYGAGDVKLGSIVSPLADEEEQRAIGKKLRDRFLGGLPAFAMLTREIQKQASLGWLPGLDGRRLMVRSKHSALNTKLQSDAALIAKKWVLLVEDILLHPKECEQEVRAMGMDYRFDFRPFVHGWHGDFVQLLWIHDEIQTAVRALHNETRDERMAIVERIAVDAAAISGKFFNYKCPISSEAKHGRTWAETH